MLRDAINEIRLHPGRFIATLLAIAISVGFLVAISTMASTEQQSVARGAAPAASKADVVVDGYTGKGGEVLDKIKAVPGVRAADAAFNVPTLVTKGERTVWTTMMSVPSEDFRWASLTEGRWAENFQEITLSGDALSGLQAQVGDKVSFGAEGPQMTVVGVTHDAKPLYSVAAYTELGPEAAGSATMWVVRTDGTSHAQVRDGIKQALSGHGLQVKTGDDFRRDSLNELTMGFDLFRNVLYGFGAVALVVGMIIISNTFTILVTQRRRQIALLRAVGASPGQVRGRLIWEALLLGLIGSLLGVVVGLAVAWGGSLVTGSSFWGLVVDWPQVLIAVLVGVLITVVSVLGPSLAATQVKPLEALQVVPTAAQAKRIGIVRAVFCGLFLLAGIGLFLLSVADEDLSLVWAILSGACLTFGILGGAPLYVAPVLRLLGKVFGFGGPTVRLAAENAARNPRRASATAVALMLAVGLIVTLQVAVSTVRTSAMSAIDDMYPVDLMVRSTEPLSEAVKKDVGALAGVERSAEVQSKRAEDAHLSIDVVNADAARKQLGMQTDKKVADDVIVVSEFSSMRGTVEVPGAGTLKVQEDQQVTSSAGYVSEATFAKVQGKTEVREVWLKLKDRNDMSVFNSVQKLSERHEGISIDGGALLAGILTQVINVLLIVLTALLGVAVLIALVGVGNTLGLSVLERQRESALLRALGMQKSSLRMMLLVEALLLALVGTVIGVAAGAFFGWLAVSSTLRMMPGSFDLKFSVDPWLTLGLIAICVLAACLASVLPGRRAANATPTEALAAE